MDEVKKYTPNSIANEIMAEDAWHDSLWVRDEDYEALRAERDALKLRLAAAEDMNAACNADFSRIRAENERLRADAERYRWLRGDQCDIVVGTNPGAMDYGMSCVSGTYEDWLGGDELDAAIDAAMRGEK